MLIKNTLAALACVALIGAAVPAAAQESETAVQQVSTRTGIVLGKADKRLTLWTKNGREVFTYTADTIMPIRKLQDGHLVVVRETTRGSREAAQVILVDDQIYVTGKLSRERAIIGTTHPSVSPGHVIIKTPDGKEAFVINPERFHQPLPQPGQRVAVTYRVENIKPPLYKATGLVILPAALDESPVKISYSDIPKDEPMVAAAPAPAPKPVAVIAELPQTASRTPLVLLSGLVLLGLGLAWRFAR